MSTPKPQVEPAKEESKKTALDRVSQLATRISVIIGVLVALYGLYDARRRAEFAVQTAKLQSLSYIQSFIKEDVDVQQAITDFDYSQLATLEAQALHDGGRHVYFSPNGAKLQYIGEHFERMGAEIKLQYLDFPLVYEIVPFPDEFWEKAKMLRNSLRANWNGKQNRFGGQLGDLWSNFEYLCRVYRAKRHEEEPTVKTVDHDPEACK